MWSVLREGVQDFVSTIAGKYVLFSQKNLFQACSDPSDSSMSFELIPYLTFTFSSSQFIISLL